MYSFNYLTSKISCFCKETYYWSLRKVGLSLEGFGEEFEIGKIAFELEDLKKDKEKRREKIGDFAFFREI